MRTILLTPLFFLTACAHTPEPSSSASPETRVQAGFAHVNRLKLYYEVHEPGGHLQNPTPLLLLHGGGSTIESNFSKFIPFIAKHRRVIAMEEQGHGHTPAIDRPFTFDNSAEDAAGLLDYLKVDKADVMGFSNGGTVALRLAHLHPNKVNKLVIASAQYRRDGMIEGFWDGMNRATLANMPEPLLEADRRINPNPKHQEQLFMQDSRRMQNFKDISESDMEAISSPALILVGDHDVITVEHAIRMARVIPHGRLAVVPGTHGSYLGEASSGARDDSKSPLATALIVSEFLDAE